MTLMWRDRHAHQVDHLKVVIFSGQLESCRLESSQLDSGQLESGQTGSRRADTVDARCQLLRGRACPLRPKLQPKPQLWSSVDQSRSFGPLQSHSCGPLRPKPQLWPSFDPPLSAVGQPWRSGALPLLSGPKSQSTLTAFRALPADTFRAEVFTMTAFGRFPGPKVKAP